MAATDDDDLLWADEVAALLGLAHSSVKANLSAARRARLDGTAGPHDLPEPAGYAHRAWPTRGGGTRVVNSPRWRRGDITACRAARAARREQVRAQSRAAASARSRDPGGTGRFRAASYDAPATARLSSRPAAVSAASASSTSVSSSPAR